MQYLLKYFNGDGEERYMPIIIISAQKIYKDDGLNASLEIVIKDIDKFFANDGPQCLEFAFIDETGNCWAENFKVSEYNRGAYSGIIMEGVVKDTFLEKVIQWK